MPTVARRKAEARKKRGHVWQVCSVALMSLIPAIVPKSPAFIVTALIAVFGVGIQAARYGYVDRPSPKVLGLILAAHVIVLSLFGWFIWPGLKVSPSEPSFAGFPNETINFSVKNNRDDDVYDVQIPFVIGHNKHLDSKFSAKVMPNGDPPQRLYDDSNYCYGKGKDVHDIKPNEQEVFIVRLRHLPPEGVGSFSITYAGGEQITAKLGAPSSISKPYSYSDMQGTVGVRGDYRICKYEIKTDGLVKQ